MNKDKKILEKIKKPNFKGFSKDLNQLADEYTLEKQFKNGKRMLKKYTDFVTLFSYYLENEVEPKGVELLFDEDFKRHGEDFNDMFTELSNIINEYFKLTEDEPNRDEDYPHEDDDE